MKRLLGVDLGTARVGLALSDEIGSLAHPLETVKAKNPRQVMERIASIVREKNVGTVVVGLPRNMDGSLGTAAKAALAFVEQLRRSLTCQVTTSDERLTTVAANRALREAGGSTRGMRQHIDQVAAQMILQDYIDRLQATSGNRPSKDLLAE